MGLFLIALMFAIHTAALLIDWLLLLLLVRVVATRWQSVVLTEMNDAARPFVNRTIAAVELLWIRSSLHMTNDRRIAAAAITLSVIRLLCSVMSGVVTIG